MSQENKNLKGERYDVDMYLAVDAEGKRHWYESDPMTCENRDAVEVDVFDNLFKQFGRPDVGNPLLVRFYCLRLERCKPFSAPDVIRLRFGKSDYICRDKEGYIVNILPQYNQGNEYPLNGVVMTSRKETAKGDMHETRTYSMDGICSDGNPDHDLILMRRAVPAKQEEDNKNV